MPSNLITLEYLATLSGMVATVSIIVQFTKSFIKRRWPDWVVRLYVLGWALILQAFLLYIRSDFTVETVGLAILNGILVSVTAIGSYEIFVDPKCEKVKLKD
ncbi:MAG: hypothetical protein MJA84_01390 [Firmicutes bacterium]|nr:hypothetical protein [Bacillota bacterium]